MKTFVLLLRFRFSPLAFFILMLPFTALAQREVPELWGTRVHDEAKVLKQQTIDKLEQSLKAYEDSTSNQIAILIVNTIGDETIETFGIRVAEKWKLGTEKKDNGTILIVAIDDHKMRIEVGHGLEAKLTDAICSRIIRNEMAPAFRRNDYDEGVNLAIVSIIKAIGGEYAAADADTSNAGEMSLTERIIIALFIFAILGVFTLIAVFSSGCAGWGLYAFLIPFYAIFPGVVIGYTAGIGILILYAIGIPVLKVIIGRTAWGKSQLTQWKNTRTSSSGNSSGSWLGSSSWGSSSGGGGFSGGGGSFGGGGSSGSW